MSKAFVNEDAVQVEEDLTLPEEVEEEEIRQRGPRYITPEGFQKLKDELGHLLRVERPKVTNEVSAAAAMGDRSENAEYIYGKKRLREIDRRIRFLSRRLDFLTVVEPSAEQHGAVRFGAWVTVEDEDGEEQTWQIVGPDEFDVKAGRISVESPFARALLGKKEDDSVVVRRPKGEVELTILEIRYR